MLMREAVSGHRRRGGRSQARSAHGAAPSAGGDRGWFHLRRAGRSGLNSLSG